LETNPPSAPNPLTIATLARRWEISALEAARRVRKFGIPTFNVGTAADPEWRFRSATAPGGEMTQSHPPPSNHH
jgi:hypothetical protein